jgi:hypothetical protein
VTVLSPVFLSTSVFSPKPQLTEELEIVRRAPPDHLQLAVTSNPRWLADADLGNPLSALRCSDGHQWFPAYDGTEKPFR